MGIRIETDMSALITEITQTGDRVMKNAARRMKQESERIEQLAKDYAPVDTGAIEDSIKIEPYREGGGRVSYMVYVDGSHTVVDEFDRTKNVGNYAYMQHEGLVPAKGGGWTYNWHPGPETRAKMAALGVFCGPKFLERAADERESAVVESVFNAVQESL